MRKERFGISIPAELSKRIKELADKRGVTRSEVVTEIVRNYVNDLEHENMPHHCSGVMIVVKKEVEISLESLYETFKEIITGYTHQHVGDLCVNVVFVSGSSQRIENLSRSLNSCGCFTRFLPLHVKEPWRET